MKILAIVLMCAFAAVQGRSALVSSDTKALAALGENPYIVYLRIAVSDNSGLLKTCSGSFIGGSWVLTAESCVVNVRFIWAKFGVVHTSRPSLVLETGVTHIHPFENLALVNCNRPITKIENVAPVALYGGVVPKETNLCHFGANEAGDAPGQNLICFRVTLEETDENEILAHSEISASEFDLGTPLVADGIQIGVQQGRAYSGNFLPLNHQVLEWIEEETDLSIFPKIAEESDDAVKVQFAS